jgi:protease II
VDIVADRNLSNHYMQTLAKHAFLRLIPHPSRDVLTTILDETIPLTIIEWWVWGQHAWCRQC